MLTVVYPFELSQLRVSLLNQRLEPLTVQYIKPYPHRKVLLSIASLPFEWWSHSDSALGDANMLPDLKTDSLNSLSFRLFLFV